MFKTKLFFIVIYFLIFLNADCLSLLNYEIYRLLSLLCHENLKNTKLHNNKTFFITNKIKFNTNRKYKDNLYNKHIKHTRSYTNNEDSTWNPYQNRNKSVYSVTSDTIVEFVNCSDTIPSQESSFIIPYEEIHTCAFDGFESLFDIIKNLKEPLRHASQKIFFDHKSFMLENGLKDFENNATRSIRAFTYWIGSRIMNTVKIGRDNSDNQGIFSSEQSMLERSKCDELIRKFVNENLEIWNCKNPKEIYIENVLYPSFNKDNPQKYIEGVWTYFNNRVFNNLLPEFREFNLEWFDIFDEKYKDYLTKSGEVFILGDINNMSFPKLMFPQQLKTCPSSLGNCVFRSMSKLLCDIYIPFNDVDYIEIIINAFKFIESNTGKDEGVNFTVIQNNYESIVNYDSDLVSLFNSKNIYSKEYDLNDPRPVFLDTNHLPFIKNNFNLLTIHTGDLNESLKIYEESFKIGKEYLSRNMWFHNDFLTIPIKQIGRSLLNGDLDEFSNIIGYSLNELLKLKPIQFNFVQNRIVSTCIKFLNYLRSLEIYSTNYLFAKNTTSPNNTIQKLNIPMVQAILFTMNVHQKSATNNSLYPLSNEFLRKSPIEDLVNVEEICQKEHSNIYETRVYNRYLKQKIQEPVRFIEEYLDPSVSSDDPDALRFLVSYFNFNLFGARLPIDINIKFKYMDYLSSNDVSSVLTKPTIYINPLFQNNKTVIPRLILNECIKIYLKWSNKLVSDPGTEHTSLNDIMEQNLEQRLKNHILSCSEQSLTWPFYLDDFYITDGQIDIKKDMYKVFRESFETEDIVKVIENMVKRDEIEQIWSNQKLPIREFLTSLFSGVYDLSYGIIVNSHSIKVTSKLDLNKLNYLENKFKEVCDIYYNMLDRKDNKINTVLYLESISIVESAFNELREQCIKNTLIYRKDLLESIADVSKILTNSVQVHHQDTSLKLDKKTHVCTTSTNSPDLFMDEVSLLGYTQKISNEDALDICLLLYNKYNKYLFHGFLPPVEIKFDDLDDLSTLKIDITDFSNPTILINNFIGDINILNSQLVLQMVSLSYYYFRRVSSDDFLNQFGEEFKSAFNVVHNTRMNYLKSKMIPINLEKKINSTKGIKDHNKEYVDFINKTLKYDNNDLVSLQANDFVYEVLEGRDKFKHIDKFSNKYESLQTLKAFAHHYFNTLSIKHKYTEDLVTNSGNINVKSTDLNEEVKSNELSENTINNGSEQTDSDGIDQSLNGMESILSVFTPGLMKDAWIKNMMDHVENKLKEKKIGLFLHPSNVDWASILDPNQQDKVIEYLSKNTNETLFTVLVNSGVFNKREAIDLITKAMYNDPIFTKNKQPTHSTSNNSDTSLSTSDTSKIDSNKKSDIFNRNSVPVEVIRDDLENEEHDLNNQTPIENVEEYFKEEMSKILGNIHPKDHETFMFFFNKLVDRDFMACRNLLNSYNSPSFLVDKSMEMLQKINSHALLDRETYNDIKQFLHK